MLTCFKYQSLLQTILAGVDKGLPSFLSDYKESHSQTPGKDEKDEKDEKDKKVGIWPSDVQGTSGHSSQKDEKGKSDKVQHNSYEMKILQKKARIGTYCVPTGPHNVKTRVLNLLKKRKHTTESIGFHPTTKKIKDSEECFRSAEQLVNEGDYEKALKHLDDYFSVPTLWHIPTNDADASLLRAICLIFVDDNTAALKELARAEKLKTSLEHYFHVCYWRCQALINSKQYEEAGAQINFVLTLCNDFLDFEQKIYQQMIDSLQAEMLEIESLRKQEREVDRTIHRLSNLSKTAKSKEKTTVKKEESRKEEILTRRRSSERKIPLLISEKKLQESKYNEFAKLSQWATRQFKILRTQLFIELKNYDEAMKSVEEVLSYDYLDLEARELWGEIFSLSSTQKNCS